MKPKIAVVEDNPDNRLLVQALLEEFYEISEFETGTEVVEGSGPEQEARVRAFIDAALSQARELLP